LFLLRFKLIGRQKALVSQLCEFADLNRQNPAVRVPGRRGTASALSYVPEIALCALDVDRACQSVLTNPPTKARPRHERLGWAMELAGLEPATSCVRPRRSLEREINVLN